VNEFGSFLALSAVVDEIDLKDFAAISELKPETY
jgi:hypothetical protein